MCRREKSRLHWNVPDKGTQSASEVILHRHCVTRRIDVCELLIVTATLQSANTTWGPGGRLNSLNFFSPFFKLLPEIPPWFMHYLVANVVPVRFLVLPSLHFSGTKKLLNHLQTLIWPTPFSSDSWRHNWMAPYVLHAVRNPYKHFVINRCELPMYSYSLSIYECAVPWKGDLFVAAASANRQVSRHPRRRPSGLRLYQQDWQSM